MIVIRILALAAWLVAAVALAVDVMSWVEKGAFAATSLGKWWFALHPTSLNLLQVVTERHLFPALWDPTIVTVLQWPAWAVFAGLALILTLLTRRRGRFHLFRRRR